MRIVKTVSSYLLILMLSLGTPFASWAQQLPDGQQVVSGTAEFSKPDANTLNITTSDKVIINYNSFNIGESKAVHFFQPGASSVALNRVVGVDPSSILGALTANGQIFLINPNGIFFGAHSVIDTGSFVASTLSLSDNDFLKGNYNFTLPEGVNPSYIINKGRITASPNGYVVLASPLVSNEGIVTANAGKVVVAGTSQIALSFDSRGLINYIIPEIAAQPGTVAIPHDQVSDLVKSVVNTNDLVEAGQVIEENGVVRLVGIQGVAVNAGAIIVDGAAGKNAGSAVIDSQQATVFAGSGIIRANGAGENSSGGEIKVLSSLEKGVTLVDSGARLEAKGGITGDGGFIEVSGKDFYLLSGSLIDCSAMSGTAGVFLLDPRNVEINNFGGTSSGGSFAAGTWTPSASPSRVDIADIRNILFGGTNVTIRTTGGGGAEEGDITVNASIDVDSCTGRTLILNASDDIFLNAPIFIDSNSATVDAVSLTMNASTSTGDVNVLAGINTWGGNINSTSATFDNTGGAIDAGGGNITITTDTIKLGSSVASAGGTVTLQPFTAARSMGIGNASVGSFNLDSAEIANLQNGFGAINIGRANSSGAVDITGATFQDPVTIRTPNDPGLITVIGQLLGIDNASITLNAGATNGTILQNNIITSGGAIRIMDNVIIDNAAGVGLSSTAGGAVPAGADIRIDGTINSSLGNNYNLGFDAGTAGNIRLDGAIGGVAGSEINDLGILTARNVNFNSTVNLAGGLGQLGGTGTTDFANTVNADRIFITTATVALNNQVTTADVLGNDIIINGNTRLDNNVVITTDNLTNDGNVQLNGNITNGAGNHSFEVKAGTGAVRLGGNSSGFSSVTLTGSSITLNGNLSTADVALNNITLNGNLLLDNDAAIDTNAVLNDGIVQLNGAVDSVGGENNSLIINSGSNDTTITGAIGSTDALNNLTIDAQNINLNNIGTAVKEGALGTVDLDAVANLNFLGTNYNANQQAYSGTENIASGASTAFTSSNDTVNFGAANTVNLADGSNLIVNSNGGTITLGTINGTAGTKSEDLTLNAAAGTVNVGMIGSTNEIRQVNLTGATVTLNGDITTADASGNDVTINGNVRLNDDSDNVLTIDTNAAGNSGAVNINGAVDSQAGENHALVIDAGTNNVVLGGNIGTARPLSYLEATGTAVNLYGNITTSDNINNHITFNGNVFLANNVTIDTNTAGTDGIVTFNGNIDSVNTTTDALNINAGTAQVVFAGPLGSINPLLSLDVDASNIVLNGNIFTDGGNVVLRSSAGTAAVKINTGITIDTENNNDGNAGNVNLSDADVSDASGVDLVIDTSTTGAGFSGGAVSLGSFGNAGGNYVNDLSIYTNGGAGGSAGNLTLNGTILLDNSGADIADLNFVGGNVIVSNSLAIDTEQGDDSNAGKADFGASGIYADAGGYDLTIDTRGTNPAGATGGDVTFGTVSNNGGVDHYLRDFKVLAKGTSAAGGTITLNGDITATRDITLSTNDHSLALGRQISSTGGAGTVTLDFSGATSDITLNNSVSGNTVTITAGNNIIDDANQATSIQAANINLNAGGSIGSFDYTPSGIDDFVDVQLGGGTLTANATGNIFISELSKGTLNTSDYALNSSTLGADLGLANLTLGGDLIVDNAIGVNQSLFLYTDRNLTVAAAGSIALNNLNDPLYLIANNNIAQNGVISTNIGNVFINADFDNSAAGTYSMGAGASLTTNGDGTNGKIEIKAAGVTINTSATPATINANNSNVLIESTTAVPINLGTNGIAGTLCLNNLELARIFTNGTLQIGNSSSGDVTISQSIAPAVGTLFIQTGGSINPDADPAIETITVNNLILDAYNGIGSTSSLHTDVNNLAARVTDSGSTGDIRIANVGAVTLNDLAAVPWGYAVYNSGTGSTIISTADTTPGANDGDLTINSPVMANGGYVNLSADHNVNQNSNILNALTGGIDVTATNGSIIMAPGTFTGSIVFVTNGSFETGDTTGWLMGYPGFSSVTTNYNGYLPVDGSYFLVLSTGAGTGVYATASQDIPLSAGATLSGWSAFSTSDYMPYNDNAYVNVYQGPNLIANLFSSSVSTVGNYGSVPWAQWSWTVPATGTYTLQFGAANQGDNGVTSWGYFDAVAGQSYSGTINYNAGTDVSLSTLSTLGDVNVTAGGAITDNNGSDNNITANNSTLSAATGIGSADPLETKINNFISVANSGTNNIDIDNSNTNATTITSISNASGDIFFSQAGGGALTVTGATTTNGDIDIDVTAANLTANTVNAGGAGSDVTLATATSGDVYVNNITAADRITINSSGVIEESVVDPSADLTGLQAVLHAANGIGNADAIETQLGQLDATNTDNAINIVNTGALQLIDLNADTYSVLNTNGSTTITALSPLTITSNVLSGSTITFTATENAVPGAGDDMNVNANVVSTGGNIVLRAGDDLIQGAASTIETQNSGNTIDLVAAYNDNDGIGIIQQAGFVQSNNGTISLSASDSTRTDISVNNVNAGSAAINVTALTRNIEEYGSDAAADLTASTIALNAVTGIGTLGAIETSATNINANTTNGKIDLDNNNSAQTYATLATGTGDILFSQAGGGILQVNSATTTDGAITIDVTGADLIADIVTAGGDKDMFLNTITGGDIFVQNISALGNEIDIFSAGAIEELNPDAGVDITAADLEMDAYTGIGNLDPIEIQVSRLNAINRTSGQINLVNTGDLVVDDFSLGIGYGINNLGGGVTLNNTGNLDIPGAIGDGIIALGDITVNTTGNLNGGIAGGVLVAQSANGIVALNAGGNLTIGSGSTVQTLGIGDVSLIGGGNVLLGNIISGGAINVQAGGSILDNNTATPYDIICAGNATLNAISGVVGTLADPLEVNVGGQLFVGAGGQIGGYSGVLNGISSDMLAHLLYMTPGLVMFNGLIMNAFMMPGYYQAISQLNPYLSNELPRFLKAGLFIMDDELIKKKQEPFAFKE